MWKFQKNEQQRLLNFLGMSNKTVILNFNTIEDNDTLNFNLSHSVNLQKFFRNKYIFKVREAKLPKPPSKYNLLLVIQYYTSFQLQVILLGIISLLCILSVSHEVHEVFPNICKVVKLKPIFKNERKLAPLTTCQSFNSQ